MRKVMAALLCASLVVACALVMGPVAANAAPAKLKVALIVAFTGLGDRGFCDSANAGLQRAIKELGITGKVIEPKSESEYIEQYRALSAEGYDLIMGLTSGIAAEIEELADEFPNVKYGIIDYAPTKAHPQVAGLSFTEHEGSFLAGALAGMMTKTNKIGYVGGVDTPLLRKFQIGYTEGAKYVNSKVEVISVIAGAFGDPTKGKELALSLFNRGCDIVYHAAGKTGDGVIAAAQQMKQYAIGVNTDQDYIAPGTVLTSMVKRVDNAVYNCIKDTQDGKFRGGAKVYGLSEGGVSLTDFTYTKNIIPSSVLSRLQTIEKDIIAGKIKVTDPTAVK